jgi:hypothetical protein
MTRDELTDENRRMNAHDRGTFQRWMITNTVVGTIWAALLAVFAITSPAPTRAQEQPKRS